MNQAVADAPVDKDLTILTDSLASIQKLVALQRRHFPELLYGQPERVLLESVCARINQASARKLIHALLKFQRIKDTS